MLFAASGFVQQGYKQCPGGDLGGWPHLLDQLVPTHTVGSQRSWLFQPGQAPLIISEAWDCSLAGGRVIKPYFYPSVFSLGFF